MTITLSDATKDLAILEAVRLAGPGAADEAVVDELRRIVGYLDPDSAIRYEFERMEKRASATEKSKTFIATVLGVDKEVSSNRGVIYLRTLPSKYHPDGKEFLRSDRLENQDAREQMNKVRSLIGHKVRVTVAIEGTGEVKVRVLRGLVDEGVDGEYNANAPDFTPSYEGLKTDKLASHGAE